MNSIPNHRGLKYDITKSTPGGLPLKLSFQLTPGSALNTHLVKPPRAAQLPIDEQAEHAWYLRFKTPENAWTYKKMGLPPYSALASCEAAISEAIRFLEAAPKEQTNFEKFQSATAERASLRCGALIEEYVAAGYPDSYQHPRTGEALITYRRLSNLARRYWDSKVATGLTQADMDDFIAWRRADTAARRAAGATIGPGDGTRAGELELKFMSQVFHWAERKRRVDRNPFATTGSYRDPEDISHASEHQPSSDEELYQLITLIAAHGHPVSAARLLFQALSGLRCHEYDLRFDATWDGREGSPGYIFDARVNGQPGRRLCVRRGKGGINPAITIHPVLGQFISSWHAFVHAKWPDSPWWFPNDSWPDRIAPLDKSGRHLAQAATELGLPKRTTHGMRAYYVAVRRSMGISDAQIAEELGQGSGPGLIVSTYGSASQIFGSGRLDWLPEQTKHSLPSIWLPSTK